MVMVRIEPEHAAACKQYLNRQQLTFVTDKPKHDTHTHFSGSKLVIQQLLGYRDALKEAAAKEPKEPTGEEKAYNASMEMMSRLYYGNECTAAEIITGLTRVLAEFKTMRPK